MSASTNRRAPSLSHSLTHRKQEVSSSNPLPQTGPEYEEVVKLRKNASYELTKPSIEMK